MIRLALFLARFAPRPMKPWIMGIAFGRRPERIDPPPMKLTTRVWVKKGYEDKARALEDRRLIGDLERDLGPAARFRFTGTDEEAQAILDEIHPGEKD